MTCSALSFCLASCLAAISLGCQVTMTFDDFVQIHSRRYAHDPDEYKMRRGIFDSNVASIDEHNCADFSLWRRGVNKFADWTKHELLSLQGERPDRARSANDHVLALTEQDVGQFLPKQVDWSNLTSMKDIQDQGDCGSCWAVSAMTVLRAHKEIWRGDSRKLSVQQLVSCMENPDHCGGSGGCGGATAGLALKYVMDNGIAHDSDFPYAAKELPCPANFLHTSSGASFLFKRHGSGRDSPGIKTVGMSDIITLPENKMAPVMRALYERGPVKVSIAVPENFFSYASGIMDGCSKNAIITHGAVLIGYGEDANLESQYWHLLNSWGADWGDEGRFKFLRRDIDYEETEACGWDTEPEKGNGCIGGPDKIKVCGMCGILSNAIVPKMIPDGGMSKSMAARGHALSA